MTSLLVHATGLAALALNVTGMATTSDRSLRSSTGWASALWALNNLLMGADAAAALSMLTVGRQASAGAVQGRNERLKAVACAVFAVVTVLIGILTWHGLITICTTLGSLIATIAMFYFRGTALRLSMVLVSALWMYNAVVYHSFWQMAANLLAAGAATYGAWRSRSENG